MLASRPLVPATSVVQRKTLFVMPIPDRSTQEHQAYEFMIAKKFLGRSALALLAATTVSVGVGAAYNSLALDFYREKAGIPGKIYDVDGRRMHLFCTGHGSPTVVLDAGLGDDSLIWAKVQPELSKTTTVCSYDHIQIDRSDLVNREVAAFVTQVRKHDFSRLDGSTIQE